MDMKCPKFTFFDTLFYFSMLQLGRNKIVCEKLILIKKIILITDDISNPSLSIKMVDILEQKGDALLILYQPL